MQLQSSFRWMLSILCVTTRCAQGLQKELKRLSIFIQPFIRCSKCMTFLHWFFFNWLCWDPRSVPKCAFFFLFPAGFNSCLLPLSLTPTNTSKTILLDLHYHCRVTEYPILTINSIQMEHALYHLCLFYIDCSCCVSRRDAVVIPQRAANPLMPLVMHNITYTSPVVGICNRLVLKVLYLYCHSLLQSPLWIWEQRCALKWWGYSSMRALKVNMVSFIKQENFCLNWWETVTKTEMGQSFYRSKWREMQAENRLGISK